MGTSNRPSSRDDFEIAIVCALPLEYDAASLVFDELWDREGDQYGRARGDQNNYTTGRIGQHNVVLALLPNMGKASAAGTAASMRSSFTRLRLAILTGICGAVPSPESGVEIMLGDIIISKCIVQYDLQRQYPDKAVTRDTIRDKLGRPNRDIRSLFAILETEHVLDRLHQKTMYHLAQLRQNAENNGRRVRYECPGPSEDKLYAPTCIHRHREHVECGCNEVSACEVAITASCEELQCNGLVSRQRLQNQQQDEQNTNVIIGPRVFLGNIGSGDTVVKSAEHRDRIASDHGLIAFEMEGAGLWDEIPCVVVKGACDYADSHKNKIWQPFAAAIAASTAKALLGLYTQTDRPENRGGAHFLVPYNPNADFVGRVSILEQIKQHFGHDTAKGPSTPRFRLSLYGLGGVGKTHIALTYAYWFRETYPQASVFWVHASNSERFHESFSAIAKQCRIPGFDDPKMEVLPLVKSWLEEKERGPWFMVVDNADDAQLFFRTQQNIPDRNTQSSGSEYGTSGQYLPDCTHGRILITTRNKQAGVKLAQGKPPIEVPNMAENEAHQLLSSLLGDEGISEEESSQLAGRLGHLPLALAQAAAFIQENGVSITTYLGILDEGDSALVERLSETFETVGRDSATSNAITATWVISFNQIEQQHSLASAILCLVSFFDRQGIPLDYVKYYHKYTRSGRQDTQDSAELTKALGMLKAFSFISQDRDEKISIHRLVQLVTQKWLADKDETSRAEFAEHALESVSRVYPCGKYETREACIQQLPHAYAVLKYKGMVSADANSAKASLLYCMGAYFMFEGQWTQAESCSIQAVDIRKEMLGETHLFTLASMNNLASIYRAQGRWYAAEKLQLQVMETCKAKFGFGHLETLASMNNLASIYRDQGRWDAAEKLQLQVMETRKAKIGFDHPKTLASMNSLALKWKAQGRNIEALGRIMECVKLRQNVLGSNHPDYVSSLKYLKDWALAVIPAHPGPSTLPDSMPTDKTKY